MGNNLNKADDDLIKAALISTNGNVLKSSEYIGVCKNYLYNRIAASEDLKKVLIESRKGATLKKIFWYENRLDVIAQQDIAYNTSFNAIKLFLSKQGKEFGWGDDDEEKNISVSNLADLKKSFELGDICQK